MFKYLFGTKGPSGFGSASTAAQVVDTFADRARGRTFVITGANTGIGKETAEHLARAGGNVILACRSADRMAAAARDVEAAATRGAQGGRVSQEVLDLSNLASVRACAERLVASGAPVHALIANAGVMMCPPTATTDGYELQFGSNVIGHWLFIHLMRPALLRAGTSTDPARVVIVASEAHRQGSLRDIPAVSVAHATASKYNKFRAYGDSKLGNILMAAELNRRAVAAGEPLQFFALHPGVIKTELGRHLGFLMTVFHGTTGWAWKTIPQGAATQTYLALAPNADPKVRYYSDVNPASCTKLANDDTLARSLGEFLDAQIKPGATPPRP